MDSQGGGERCFLRVSSPRQSLLACSFRAGEAAAQLWRRGEVRAEKMDRGGARHVLDNHRRQAKTGALPDRASIHPPRHVQHFRRFSCTPLLFKHAVEPVTKTERERERVGVRERTHTRPSHTHSSVSCVRAHSQDGRHGKAFGLLTWGGKTKSEPELIPGTLKRIWRCFALEEVSGRGGPALTLPPKTTEDSGDGATEGA